MPTRNNLTAKPRRPLRGRAAREAALKEANELAAIAWDLDDPEERMLLASEALNLSDLCVDAYSILAEEVPNTTEDALHWYEAAVAAGKKVLGPRRFKECAGKFWHLEETRPYMRARAALGHALWQLDRRAEAITHYQDLLRLNPNDDQGLRYLLVGWLYAVGSDHAVESLLAQYGNEAAAEWPYTETLMAFRQGDEDRTHVALEDAWQFNPHVPGLLAGAVPLPENLPEEFDSGTYEEAACYTALNEQYWTETEGAVQWLAEAVQTFLPPIEQRH